MPKPAQTGSKREQNRAHIIEVTRQLMLSEGRDAVTVRAVAKRAGISASAIYYYFDSQLALLNAVWHSIKDVSDERLATLLDKVDDPVECLREFAWGYVEVGINEREQFDALFLLESYGQGGGSPVVNEKPYDTGHEAVRKLIIKGMDSGAFDAVDVELAAQSLWALIHGITRLRHDAEGFAFVEAEVLFKHAFGMWLRELGYPDPPEQR